MINIALMEQQNPEMTQLELARALTFDFSPTMVHTAMNFWGDSSDSQILLSIIDNKLLLEDRKESLSSFFDRVGRMDIIGKDLVETIRPFVKSGRHVSTSESLLTSDNEFVSLNENDYCIRITPWFIHTVNGEFSMVINDNFSLKMMVVSGNFNDAAIAKKKDVKSFNGKTIVMKSGQCIEFRRM